MPDVKAGPGPNPMLIFEAMNAYQRSAAIKGAIELGVFSLIADGYTTAADIAGRCQAAERGVRILCDFLTIQGFLTKHAGQYGLTPDAATFLNSKSPAYLGKMVEFLLSPDLVKGFDDVAGAVRKGGTILPRDGTVSHDNPIWVNFARAMAPAMARPAQLLAELLDPQPTQPLRVLDIAAGHGLFGIALGRRNPQAHVTALDWKNVLAVATDNAKSAGMEDRYTTISGSAFDANLGGPYDIVLLTNFLHHFDVPTCERLIKRVYAVLVPGGRSATVEFIPNDDRVTPPDAASFSFTMLNTTGAGDAYTFAEIDGMFRRSGFARNEMIVLPGALNSAVISTR